jgi:hypothetical protein
MNYLGPCLPAGKKSLFQILWSGKVSGLSDNVMVVPAQKKQEPLLAAAAMIKQKHPGKLLLNIIGIDVMQKSLPNPKDIRHGIEQLMSAVRASDLSIAVIGRSQKDMLEYLSKISDVHLRLLMINDTLFLQALVPASTLYAVVFDGRSGISLEPAV